MQEFHLERSLNEAADSLDRLPPGRWIPFRVLGKAALALLLFLAALAVFRVVAPDQFRVTAARILNPDADIPPYSPLNFEVTPGDLEVHYGGEALAQVVINGGEITEDVHCLIRDAATGTIEQSAAYQESPGHYARKFSNTLASAEFAFACGHARSAWHKLEVLLQPKVSGVVVTVNPPAYTDAPVESFPLETGEIKVLEGSTVTLDVQSNRPLSGGDLLVEPLVSSGDSVPLQVQGDAKGDHQVRFSWSAHASSRISATIRDVRSTPSENPLELKLNVIPDQAPVIDMISPELMVLATPGTDLSFAVQVEDDHGLANVSLVRALLGYRDRSRTLADSLAKRTFDFAEPLKLGELGVEVGQVLEFYLEAMDRNPSLLGRGVSEVVRVKIISVEDYAERIRSEVQLREFTARYRALAGAVREAREALANLDEAADLGGAERFEKAREEADAAHAKAAELARRMARDFQAFAMESRLGDIAEEAAGKLEQNQAELGELNLAAGEAAARRSIEAMQERLGGVRDRAEQIEADAEVVRKVGRVMEMAAEMKRIHLVQQSLVERLGVISKEVAMGNTTNTAQLDGLGRQQERNREALLKLAKDLKERSDALPPGLEQMQRDVAGFLDALKALDIQNPMQTAALAAAKGKTIDASANAALALTLIEKLINQPDNGF